MANLAQADIDSIGILRNLDDLEGNLMDEHQNYQESELYNLCGTLRANFEKTGIDKEKMGIFHDTAKKILESGAASNNTNIKRCTRNIYRCASFSDPRRVKVSIRDEVHVHILVLNGNQGERYRAVNTLLDRAVEVKWGQFPSDTIHEENTKEAWIDFVFSRLYDDMEMKDPICLHQCVFIPVGALEDKRRILAFISSINGMDLGMNYELKLLRNEAVIAAKKSDDIDNDIWTGLIGCLNTGE